jgi:hypothetical protein
VTRSFFEFARLARPRRPRRGIQAVQWTRLKGEGQQKPPIRLMPPARTHGSGQQAHHAVERAPHRLSQQTHRASGSASSGRDPDGAWPRCSARRRPGAPALILTPGAGLVDQRATQRCRELATTGSRLRPWDAVARIRRGLERFNEGPSARGRRILHKDSPQTRSRFGPTDRMAPECSALIHLRSISVGGQRSLYVDSPGGWTTGYQPPPIIRGRPGYKLD